eukprot:COSAG01_NODE_57837_length_309_cov_3.342857_1_plen_48_part_10
MKRLRQAGIINTPPAVIVHRRALATVPRYLARYCQWRGGQPPAATTQP